MIKVERNFTVDRPVDEVFAFLSDVEHSPRYIAGQREAHITSTGPVGVGTTFRISGTFLRHGATCEVTDYEPDRRVAWHTTSGAVATTNWDFQRSGSSTRVNFVYTQEPARHVWLHLPEWLQQERANERADRDLWTLKELLAPSKRAAKAWTYQVPPSVPRPQSNNASNASSSPAHGSPTESFNKSSPGT